MTTVAKLQEYATMSGARVDRDRGIISGVKILGRQSKNGREYSADAVREAAAIYNNAKVNVDHVDNGQRRPYAARIGRLENVVARSDGLYGDLHFNPKHPLAEQLAWDAENAPGNCGLSHDAEGRVTRKGGRDLVEKITRVVSVDLVADPASTAGLFESVDDPTPHRYGGPASWSDESPREDSARVPEAVQRWSN